MSLRIETIMVKGYDKIRESIVEFNSENCIVNFGRYVCVDFEEISCDLERRYVKELNENLEDLCLEIFIDKMKTLTKEELIDKIVNIQKYGTYSFEERYDSDYIEFLKDNIEDEKAYDYIYRYMKKTLDDLIEKDKETANKLKIKNLKKEIENYSESIKSFTDKIKQKEQLLNELLESLN